jgi:hypothetical protein
MPSLFAAEPSPLMQTAVYMAAMLTGYALLTPPEDWSRAWRTVRTAWSRRRD